MKISEIIRELKSIKKEHGDIDAVVMDYEYWGCPLDTETISVDSNLFLRHGIKNAVINITSVGT